MVSCDTVAQYVTIFVAGNSNNIPLTLCNVNVLTANSQSGVLCTKQTDNTAGYLVLNGKCYLRKPDVSFFMSFKGDLNVTF